MRAALQSLLRDKEREAALMILLKLLFVVRSCSRSCLLSLGYGGVC